MGPKEFQDLTESQESLIFQAAGKRVAASVTRQSCERLRDLLLGELGSAEVLGAFVSLKQNGKLRACMGCLADSMKLADAVETAASRAAADDPRFPPISPIELESLDMEVWILWGMQRINVPAKDRAGVIVIGKHGLQIEYSPHRGLLLPAVATEHNMDAVGFLEAVCQKAGLPNKTWLDEKAKISTFEGRAISGPFSIVLTNHRIAPKYVPRMNGPGVKDVFGLCNAARENFFRALDGLTPHCYQTDFFDGNINGLALSITLPDAAPIVCAQHEMKPAIPLQISLVKFAGALAEQIHRIGTPPEDLLAAHFALTIQWDIAFHGSTDDFDVSAIDTSTRSLMLNTKDGWAILFDPAKSSDELMDDAWELLGVDPSVEGTIYSFETVSTMSRFELTSFPRDPVFPALRPATLAGSFYPAQAKDIEAELQRMFQGMEKIEKKPYFAAMVPHAGWVYSGRLAAETLAHIEVPETVMIFAPKHRPGGVHWAVGPFQTWGIPFGNVTGNLEMAEDFVHLVPQFRLDPIPHKQEHAIEVQLPLLTRLREDVKVIGITMGSGEWDEIREAATQFAQFLGKMKTPPLLLISSDLNHFDSEEMTQKLDRMVLDAIQKLDPEKLLEAVMQHRISMCGVCAAAFIMETLKQLGRLNEAIEIGHTTSGSVSGDHQRVVGYAGVLFR